MRPSFTAAHLKVIIQINKLIAILNYARRESQHWKLYKWRNCAPRWDIKYTSGCASFDHKWIDDLILNRGGF